MRTLLLTLSLLLVLLFTFGCTGSTPSTNDDVVHLDAVEDSSADQTSPDSTPDLFECQVDADCGACGICSGGSCLDAHPQCMQDSDCPPQNVCTPSDPSAPQCGGACEFIGEPAPYTVHEWGVNLVESDSASRLVSSPDHYMGAIPAKPVLYVYSPDERSIDVRVDFSSGQATDTWPARPNAQSVVWNEVQVHNGACETTNSPLPTGEGPWRELYELPSWVVGEASCLVTGGVVSKLLFYTGVLANYDAPLLIDASMADTGQGTFVRFQVTNRSIDPIGPIMLMYRDAAGFCIDPSMCPVDNAELAWGTLEGIAPGATEVVMFPLVSLQAGTEGQVIVYPDGWLAQTAELGALLTNAGLFPAEIQVFHQAWDALLFGVFSSDIVYSLPGYSNGAFALYQWSERHTAEQLALTITPPPTELRRAILEYQKVSMTPRLTGTVEGKVELAEYAMDPTTPVYVGPAPGAIVAAYQGTAMIAETVVDEAGLYGLPLPAGVYVLTASRNAWETTETASVQVVAGELLSGINFQLMSTSMADKPNLYLYPTQTTQVQVEIGLHSGCEVTVSDPEYGTGWDVNVEPSGLIDGQHTFLFYEAEVPHRFPKERGWVIPASEVVPFFNQLMNLYGFTAAETFDFVDYWKDHLPSAPYYAVYPLTDAAVLDPLATLDIQPKPDSLFRLWFVVSPEANAIPMVPAKVEPMTRQGFAAVEWGVVLD